MPITTEPEHISDDGLTALCGKSLVDPDAPERPFCPACAVRVPTIAPWRARLSRNLFRLALRVEQ